MRSSVIWILSKAPVFAGNWCTVLSLNGFSPINVWLLGYICSWNVGRLDITLSYVLLWRYSDASENSNSNVSFWKDKVLLRMTLWGDPDTLFWFSLLLSIRVIGVSMRYSWRTPSPQASENYLAAFGHRMLM